MSFSDIVTIVTMAFEFTLASNICQFRPFAIAFSFWSFSESPHVQEGLYFLASQNSNVSQSHMTSCPDLSSWLVCVLGAFYPMHHGFIFSQGWGWACVFLELKLPSSLYSGTLSFNFQPPSLPALRALS